MLFRFATRRTSTRANCTKRRSCAPILDRIGHVRRLSAFAGSQVGGRSGQFGSAFQLLKSEYPHNVGVGPGRRAQRDAFLGTYPENLSTYGSYPYTR